MSTHGIVCPLAATIAGDGMSALNRALTVEPKEVAVSAAGGAIQVTLDLGAATQIDTVYIGFTNAGDATALQLSHGLANGFQTNIDAPIAPAATKRLDPVRHYFKWLPVPVNARYIGIAGNVPAGFEIGVIAVGKAWSPAYGQEMGSGRGIIDTGSATRRLDGGFGIVRGARAGTWQWTLGDLSDEERDELYALLFAIGETGTALVIEDTELGGVQADKLHWSLFRRIEAYERRDVGLTRWGLKLEDWA